MQPFKQLSTIAHSGRWVFAFVWLCKNVSHILWGRFRTRASAAVAAHTHTLTWLGQSRLKVNTYLYLPTCLSNLYLCVWFCAYFTAKRAAHALSSAAAHTRHTVAHCQHIPRAQPFIYFGSRTRNTCVYCMRDHLSIDLSLSLLPRQILYNLCPSNSARLF